jgi:hypothetical protein
MNASRHDYWVGTLALHGLAALITVLVALSFLTTPGAAAGLANARAMGMAGAYISLARGNDCPSFNPANLGLDGGRKSGLQFFGLGVSVSNNSFSLDDYNHYTGANLSEADKDELLDKIPSEGLKVSADAEVTAFGLSLGNLAVSLSAIGAAEINMGRTPMELLLEGNAMADTLDLEGMYGEGYGLASVNVSYGQRLYKNYDRQLAVGGTFHYLRGLGYEEVTELNGYAATLPTGYTGAGSLTSRTATGGSGYAVDLAAALKVSKSYTVGVTVFNLYSHIRWDQDTKEHRYTFSFDTLTLAMMDGDSLITSEDTTVAISPFTSQLPSLIRVGLAHTAGRLLWAIDWEQGFKRGAGTSANPRVSAGAEYRLIGFLPLRAGMAVGGKAGTTYAAGLGLDFSAVYLDFGAANYNAVSAASGKGLTIGVQTGIRF